MLTLPGQALNLGKAIMSRTLNTSLHRYAHRIPIFVIVIYGFVLLINFRFHMIILSLTLDLSLLYARDYTISRAGNWKPLSALNSSGPVARGSNLHDLRAAANEIPAQFPVVRRPAPGGRPLTKIPVLYTCAFNVRAD